MKFTFNVALFWMLAEILMAIRAIDPSRDSIYRKHEALFSFLTLLFGVLVAVVIQVGK